MHFELSRHAQARCQQRGIFDDDVRIIMQLGTETSFGVMFGRREADIMLSKLRNAIRQIERIKNACVVTDGNTAITVYRATKHKPRKAHRRGK